MNYIPYLNLTAARINISISFRDEHYVIETKFEQIVSRDNGLLHCDTSNDPIKCREIMGYISGKDPAEIKIRLIVKYYSGD